MRRFPAAAALAIALVLPACTDSPPGNPNVGNLNLPKGSDHIAKNPPRVEMPLDSALREAARQELLSALSNQDPSIRSHALEGLREGLGSGARDELIKALADKDQRVRFAALAAIGELKLEDAKDAVLPLLQDKSAHVRAAAIFALHRMGDARHSAGLENAAIRDPQPEVRGNAAFLLGRTAAPSAAKVLRHMMSKDPSVEVRLQAAEGLWRIEQPEDAMKYLITAGLARDPSYPQLAFIALAGPGDRRIIQHVRSGLASEYPEVQLVAVRALGMLSSDEGFQAAVNATTASEARLRYLAAHALGAIGRPDAQPALRSLLRDRDPQVRVAAASAILQLR